MKSRASRTTVAIAVIIAAIGLAGCASSGETDDVHQTIAEEFMRRGFTDPVMTPIRGAYTGTEWSYSLDNCRLTAFVPNSTPKRIATWNRISDASTLLTQAEYAHCTADAKQ